MTLSRYTLRPTVRAALLAFLVHHNPFYLLSALCMLSGCYALNIGLSPRTGELAKLLLIIGTLNAYELLLIALGLYLIRRRGMLRDGRTLLLLEAVFLVDLAFIETEAGSLSVRVGLALSGLVVALAAVKELVILRVLWGRIPLRLAILMGAQLATLFYMPVVFTHWAHGAGVTAGQFYGSWWIIGALLAGYAWVAQSSAGIQPTELDRLRRLMASLYVLLPVASLITHLSMLHWVYRAQFSGGDLSPILLGGTIALAAAPKCRGMRTLRMLMPLTAVALAANSPPRIILIVQAHAITPAVLTVGAAYVTVVCCFFLPRIVPLLGTAAGITLFVLFGPTLQQILLTAVWCWRRVIFWSGRLLPQTAIEWGVAAMGAAFAFLAFGAAVSLKNSAGAAVPSSDGPVRNES